MLNRTFPGQIAPIVIVGISVAVGVFWLLGVFAVWKKRKLFPLVGRSPSMLLAQNVSFLIWGFALALHLVNYEQHCGISILSTAIAMFIGFGLALTRRISLLFRLEIQKNVEALANRSTTVISWYTTNRRLATTPSLLMIAVAITIFFSIPLIGVVCGTPQFFQDDCDHMGFLHGRLLATMIYIMSCLFVVAVTGQVVNSKIKKHTRDNFGIAKSLQISSIQSVVGPFEFIIAACGTSMFTVMLTPLWLHIVTITHFIHTWLPVIETELARRALLKRPIKQVTMEVLIATELGYTAFCKFLSREFSTEHLFFLREVQKYKELVKIHLYFLQKYLSNQSKLHPRSQGGNTAQPSFPHSKGVIPPIERDSSLPNFIYGHSRVQSVPVNMNASVDDSSQNKQPSRPNTPNAGAQGNLRTHHSKDISGENAPANNNEISGTKSIEMSCTTNKNTVTSSPLLVTSFANSDSTSSEVIIGVDGSSNAANGSAHGRNESAVGGGNESAVGGGDDETVIKESTMRERDSENVNNDELAEPAVPIGMGGEKGGGGGGGVDAQLSPQISPVSLSSPQLSPQLLQHPHHQPHQPSKASLLGLGSAFTSGRSLLSEGSGDGSKHNRVSSADGVLITTLPTNNSNRDGSEDKSAGDDASPKSRDGSNNPSSHKKNVSNVNNFLDRIVQIGRTADNTNNTGSTKEWLNTINADDLPHPSAEAQVLLEKYFAVDSLFQINISTSTRNTAISAVRSLPPPDSEVTWEDLAAYEMVFDEALSEVTKLLSQDSYPRFQRSQEFTDLCSSESTVNLLKKEIVNQEQRAKEGEIDQTMTMISLGKSATLKRDPSWVSPSQRTPHPHMSLRPHVSSKAM